MIDKAFRIIYIVYILDSSHSTIDFLPCSGLLLILSVAFEVHNVPGLYNDHPAPHKDWQLHVCLF